MTVLHNMQEYTEWFVKDAMNLGKYDIKFVRIESINKVLCVCGTPNAIEYMADRGSSHFIGEWNYKIKDEAEQDMLLDVDDDIDLVSDLRDKILSSLEQYKNMEIVFVSTEY